MDRGNIDPVGVRLEAPVNLRRVEPDIVVVVAAAQGMDAVGTQRHVMGCARGGGTQPVLQLNKAALDSGLVAHLHEIARHAGVGAHGAAILARGVVILQHRLDHEGGKVALLRLREFAQAGFVIRRNLDPGPEHRVVSRLFDPLRRNHGFILLNRNIRPIRFASRPPPQPLPRTRERGSTSRLANIALSRPGGGRLGGGGPNREKSIPVKPSPPFPAGRRLRLLSGIRRVLRW
jgi:hypothetical protein